MRERGRGRERERQEGREGGRTNTLITNWPEAMVGESLLIDYLQGYLYQECHITRGLKIKYCTLYMYTSNLMFIQTYRYEFGRPFLYICPACLPRAVGHVQLFKAVHAAHEMKWYMYVAPS